MRLPTCPDFCANPHLEAPGDLVHHYEHAYDIPTVDGGRPLTVFVGYYEHDMRVRVEVGDKSFDLDGARTLLKDLALKVARAERLQASLDADAYLDALLDRYQVA